MLLIVTGLTLCSGEPAQTFTDVTFRRLWHRHWQTRSTVSTRVTRTRSPTSWHTHRHTGSLSNLHAVTETTTATRSCRTRTRTVHFCSPGVVRRRHAPRPPPLLL